MVAESSARGSPVVSVTSEVSANTSFQNAAARSARPDSEPPVRNDSFAALVDSNTAASNNDTRTQDNAPAPRRADDAQAASDNRSRDNAVASDKAARNDSNDRNAVAKSPKTRHAATRHATTRPIPIPTPRPRRPAAPNRRPTRRSPMERSPTRRRRPLPATLPRQPNRPGRRRMERPW